MTITEIRQRQERFGTAAEWTTANTVLLMAEIGMESDTGKGKIGDEVTPWNSLAYSIVRGIDTDLALKADIISEPVVLLAFAANVLTVDLSTGNVKQVTVAPTAAWTANITNAPTTNGKSITVSLMVTQGATGYIPTTFQIAGAAQTIKWAGGTAPTPTSGAGYVDIFSFTLLRMAGAWIVYGSMLAKF